MIELAMWAEKRGALVCTPILETLMMCPDLRARIAGRKPRISRSAPK